MSILSGYGKFKRYVLTSAGYKLCSQWTSSNTVHFNDGNTAQTKVGAINGITDSLTATNSNVALSSKAGKNLQDQVTQLNTGLGGKLDSNGGVPSVEGVKLGGSAFAYVYGDNDDVYIRYKDAAGKAAYASAKTIMELIAAINSMLSKTTTTTLTSVTANPAGTLYPSVPSWYAVKNGWCVFHIWMAYTGSVGNWYPFYLSKTAVSHYLYFEDNYEHNGQLRIEQSGRVRISNTKASAVASHYWGCYPIS